MTIQSKFDLAGRSALVTGAASGLGLAYAEAMAEGGAGVTLTDIDGDAAEAEAARLRQQGFDARGARLDVTDREATRAVVDDHVAAFGGLQIAFANAGVDAGEGFWNPDGHRNPEGQVDAYDPTRWDLSIGVNLTGVFNTIRDCVRAIKATGGPGSVIATSSNAAVVNEPIVGLPYMPAKAGVKHMVEHLALELAAFGIRVNAIAPGPFVTNIGGGWLKKDPVVRRKWDSLVPLGRVAETEQIKPLALFLASDASDYMTGAHLMIDGGMALGKFE